MILRHMRNITIIMTIMVDDSRQLQKTPMDQTGCMWTIIMTIITVLAQAMTVMQLHRIGSKKLNLLLGRRRTIKEVAATTIHADTSTKTPDWLHEDTHTTATPSTPEKVAETPHTDRLLGSNQPQKQLLQNQAKQKFHQVQNQFLLRHMMTYLTGSNEQNLLKNSHSRRRNKTPETTESINVPETDVWVLPASIPTTTTSRSSDLPDWKFCMNS